MTKFEFCLLKEDNLRLGIFQQRKYFKIFRGYFWKRILNTFPWIPYFFKSVQIFPWIPYFFKSVQIASQNSNLSDDESWIYRDVRGQHNITCDLSFCNNARSYNFSVDIFRIVWLLSFIWYINLLDRLSFQTTIAICPTTCPEAVKLHIFLCIQIEIVQQPHNRLEHMRYVWNQLSIIFRWVYQTYWFKLCEKNNSNLQWEKLSFRLKNVFTSNCVYFLHTKLTEIPIPSKNRHLNFLSNDV
jgi:hypothetical protein